MKNMNLLVAAAVLLSGAAGYAAEADAGLSVARLRCEYKENPLGIDANPPRLSWVVQSENRGARQTGYQVLVASSLEQLAVEQGDVWDSGKVASPETVLVPYGGVPLESGRRCYWKVRAWDENGRASAWSEPAFWSMGLLAKSDWQGKYIGLPKVDSPMLRKTVNINGAPKHACIYVNTLGYYELYVNGRKVGDTILTPAAAQFDKRSFYLAHDVTAYLKEGANVIGLWLGRGWYTEKLPGVAFSGPVVRAQLEVDGETAAVTDASWQAVPSGYCLVGSWHSGQYGGERYDRRAMPADFWTGAETSSAVAAVEAGIPDHIVMAQPAEPNRVQRCIEPISVSFVKRGEWLVDFGINLTGLFKGDFPETGAGAVVRLEYGDRLEGEELDSFDQIDEVVGGGHFENRFNYHAFRYVRITGLEQPPAVASMHAELVRTDYPVYSSFACSNTRLTQIHNMVQYTLQCLSLGGHLVDCPHIERLGYGGDGQASTPTAMTMFGLGPLYTNWLAHWRDCQREDGAMPHTAPTPWSAGGGPYWCGFIIAASWEMYQDYGDRRILELDYPAMRHWFDYVDKYTVDGLLRRWPDTDYRGWYLGDWARPGRVEKEAERSVDLVNNCFLVQCCDWMVNIATLLGHSDDARQFTERAQVLRARIQEVFYDAARGTYADDTQLDLAYPLLANVTPDAMRASILKRLEDNIRVDHKGHLDVGLVGVPILTRTLMDMGRSDLVFDYTNQETFPGWGYMIANGATTTWEHWDGDRSHIHNCYNGIGAWFYRGLAGINPDSEHPGYAHFFLRPVPTGDVQWVNARQDTVRGPIESGWKIDNGVFTWNVLIPANTTATVAIPAADAQRVQESGNAVPENGALTFLRAENGRVFFEAASGRYTFTATLPK